MSGKHCETCICGRRAPVQGEYRDHPCGGKPAGTVAWWEHLKAAADYNIRHAQSAEHLAERGGFGYWEITGHLGHEPTTWEPR